MKKSFLIIIIIILIGFTFGYFIVSMNKEEKTEEKVENKIEEGKKDEENQVEADTPPSYPLTKVCILNEENAIYKYTMYVYEDGNFEKYDYYYSKKFADKDSYFSYMYSNDDTTYKYVYNDDDKSVLVDVKNQLMVDSEGNSLKISYDYYKDILETTGYKCD